LESSDLLNVGISVFLKERFHNADRKFLLIRITEVKKEGAVLFINNCSVAQVRENLSSPPGNPFRLATSELSGGSLCF